MANRDRIATDGGFEDDEIVHEPEPEQFDTQDFAAVDNTPVRYWVDDYMCMSSYVECVPTFMDGKVFAWDCQNHPQADDYAPDGLWRMDTGRVRDMIAAGIEMLKRSGDEPTPREIITGVMDRVGPKARDFLKVALDIISEEAK